MPFFSNLAIKYLLFLPFFASAQSPISEKELLGVWEVTEGRESFSSKHAFYFDFEPEGWMIMLGDSLDEWHWRLRHDSIWFGRDANADFDFVIAQKAGKDALVCFNGIAADSFTIRRTALTTNDLFTRWLEMKRSLTDDFIITDIDVDVS